MESDKRSGVVAARLGTRLLSGPKGVRLSPSPPELRDRGRMDMQQTLNLSNGGSIPSGPTNAVLA